MVSQKFAGGNQTASALLRFAIGLGCDFEDIRKKIKIEKAYPFNSAKKQVRGVRGVRCVKVTIKQICILWLHLSGFGVGEARR